MRPGADRVASTCAGRCRAGCPPTALSARRDVFQPRDLDLQLGFAAMGMTMENLYDHAGPIEDLRSGRALEVASLARRDVMIDDHEFRLRRRLRIGLAPGDA